jgi:hypothetical protein
MRSLITYNSDESDWPVSRDAAYITVLSSVLTDALSAPIFNLAVLHENAIALVALEEIMGVREPRLACTKGYQVALRNTVSKLINGEETPEGLWERVEEVEVDTYMNRCICIYWYVWHYIYDVVVMMILMIVLSTIVRTVISVIGNEWQ